MTKTPKYEKDRHEAELEKLLPSLAENRPVG